MRALRHKLLASLMIAITLAACAGLHRQPNPNGPTTPITPLEKLNFDNAQIAIHNRAVAKGIVAIQQTGFIEKEYFDLLSAGEIKITRIHQQLTPLLKNPNAGNVNQIQALTKELRDTAVSMVNNGTAGIKNSQSKEDITAEINSIVYLANSVLSTLATVGAIK